MIRTSTGLFILVPCSFRHSGSEAKQSGPGSSRFGFDCFASLRNDILQFTILTGSERMPRMKFE